jgi:hypothetical protein
MGKFAAPFWIGHFAITADFSRSITALHLNSGQATKCASCRLLLSQEFVDCFEFLCKADQLPQRGEPLEHLRKSEVPWIPTETIPDVPPA